MPGPDNNVPGPLVWCRAVVLVFVLAWIGLGMPPIRRSIASSTRSYCQRAHLCLLCCCGLGLAEAAPFANDAAAFAGIGVDLDTVGGKL